VRQVNEVPEEYEGTTDDFNELYLLAWLLIIRALGKLIRLPPNPTSTLLLELERTVNKEVAVVFKDLNNKAIPLATEKVNEAYIEGIRASRLSLMEKTPLYVDKETEFEIVEENLTDSHEARLNKMLQQTQDDLLKATGNTQENIKRLVRQVVSKEIGTVARSGMIDKRSNMAIRIEDQLRKQFLANGIKNADVAIIDKAKRRWKLKTYSEMVARTKMSVAYIDAIREEALNDGSDLAIISTKPDTTDACLNYEGMIISLNGLTSGYLTYEQIRATKLCFHPNCGHFVRPVGGLEWIPESQIAIHEKKMQQYRKDSN